MSRELREKLLNALKSGKKIEAIKVYREITGKGLKESKQAVEKFIDEIKVQHPDVVAKLRPGCSTGILIMLFIVVMCICF